ncbi:MAG: CTP-dependent riboflavin kinase [Candidatus Lokiarchaeota archaeon]|nr:CTP-dependent riboflavin kinase [Candidatus Lokiarchaeota archaeon]
MLEREDTSPEMYTNWFALYTLGKYSEDMLSLRISSIEFGKLLNVSQQTASRRINDLEKLGWIEREIEGKTQHIIITEEGINILFKTYENLKDILEKILIIGEVSEGMREGGYYVAIKGYYEQFKAKLGFEPFKGTLNLKIDKLDLDILKDLMSQIKPITIKGFEDQNREYGPVYCYDVYISPLFERNRKIKAAILDIQRTHHKKNIIEILAKEYLRDYFNLKDGDKLVIKLNRINESNPK